MAGKRSRIQRDKVKEKEYVPLQKSIAIMAAVGFLVNSISAAGEITGAGGVLNPTIETNGNKTDIWAGKVQGENAFNHFNKFNVNANEIANMYFKQQNKNEEANRLFNFVNEQINVNGTVNAIKNGKIGGDLYFLSSSGMVVGNTGVINTGALYVMTPTSSAFDKVVEAARIDGDLDDIIPKDGNVSIPLNPKGTITVRGQINAVDHIALYAPTIQVGNVGTSSGEENYTNKVNLQTGVVDFSNLVNTNGVSGLSGEALKATKTGDGDIILRAYSDGSSTVLTEAELSIESVQEFLSIVGQLLGDDHKAKIETALKNGSSLVSEIDKLRPVLANAKIEINAAKIISAGNFTAEATAINKTIEDGESGNAIALINAEVNIKNSTIKAKKDVNIKAVANSIYVAEEEEEEAEGEEEKPSKLEQNFNKLFGSFSVDASVGVQKSSAVVNLDGSNITAGTKDNDGNINISAENKVSVEIGAEIAPEEEAGKEKAGGTTKKKKKLAAAAAVIYADGDAKVNINNTKLTATKGVNISSSSINELNLNAGTQSAGETFTAAIGVTVGRNNSEVSITGSTIESGDELNITSEVENSISSTVAAAAEGAPAKGQSGTGGSTGTGTGNTGSGTTGTNKNNSGKLGIGATVNVVDYDSDSTINIENSNLTSTRDTNIASKNTISENTIVADNTMGTDQSKFAKKTAMAEEKFDAFVEQVAGLFPGGEEQAQTRAAGTTGGTGTGTATAKSKVTAGAAVGVINEENSSNVTIKNSSVKASGDLNITSETLIEDTHVSIAGDTYSGNTPKKNGSTGSGSTGTGTGSTGTGGTGTKDNAISAAVLYSDIDNTSSITITDDKNTTEAKTTLSGTNVNISSNVTMEYGRIDAMIDDLEEAQKTLGDALTKVEILDTYKEEIQDKIDRLTKLIKDMKNYGVALKGEDGGFVGERESFLSENSFTRMGEIAKEGVTLVNDIVTLIKNIPEELPEGVKKQVVEDLNLFKAMIETATDFADGGNYANFYVRTATNDNNDKGTGLRIAGSAAINNLNNSSNINIGNVKIEATDNGNVNISATNKTDTISIVGNMQELTLGIIESTGENAKTTAVGGSFGMQNLENNSTITITEGTELVGNNITVATANDVFNVTASLSSGHSGKDAFNGMVSYVKGNSNSSISIDDETNITAGNNIDISAINNSSLTNVAGAVVRGGNVAVGVSAAVNEYDVTTKAEIKDNDTSDGLYTADKNGTLTGNSLDVNANTDGMINAISVAGGMSKEKNDQQSSSGLGGTGLGTGGSTGASINNAIGQAQGGLNNGLTTSGIQGAMNSGNASQGGGRVNIEGNNEGGAKLDLAGAGSVSINLNDNVTSAGIDGVNIVLSGNDKNISVEAKDEGFIGAWSGAAAINWSSKNGNDSTGGSSGTKVAVEGAVGLNILTNNTSAIVNNVNVTNANSIDINAVNDSVVVAAGLGLGVSNDGSTYAGGASVSLNLIDHYTTATLGGSDTEVSRDDKDTTDINVTALESGIQVTGGVNIQAGKAKGALGGAVTVGIINNNVTAGINGGKYNNIGNIAVDGTLNMTQVTAAAAIGITKTESNGENNGLSFQGAVVYNEVDNIVSSGIKDATINASGDVAVTAGDSNIKKDTSNKYTSYLENKGIDADGSSYYDGLDISSTEDDYTKAASKSSDTAKNIENNKKGTTIITATGVVSGSTGNAVGAGVIYDNITNKFTAEISNSTIGANNVSAEASADTFIVGAAGGVAASTKGKVGAMGSVSWQELNNTVKAAVSNSNITANKLGVNAQNTAFEVNVGGQISASRSIGAGAVLAYSNVNNNTSAEISGGSIDSSDTEVNANSETEVYTIGAGVSASGNIALAGTVALNRTNNTTEASIKDKTTLTGVKNLNVQAINNDDLMNIVATVTGAKSVAVGGSVAYSDIKNNVIAGIYNANITTAETGEEDKERTINVTADDKSEILTVAAAAGGSATAAVEGAATTAIVNKTVNANLNNTDIDNTDAERADIQVTANNTGEIISSAGAVSGSGTAAVGAGVAVNKITNNTNASFDGGTQFVKNALVKGLSQADILTIGIGASGAGTAGITGSVAINQIANNNNVSMSGTNLIAKGNVGVIAQSDDVISNYAGTLAAGGAAGVGVSTSVNEISGDTKVTIDGSKITAKGETDESITTKGQIDEVVDGLVKEMEIDSNLANDRTGSTHKGVVIDSSSTHTLKSLLANAGLGGTAAVNGTVSVNQISGSTGTAINDSTITGKDVSVHTGDYTNSIGFVGTLSVGGAAGVGGGSDTHIIDRKLETSISDSEINTDNNINIDNDAKQGISSTTAAGALGGTGGVGATVTVTQLSGQTLLNISDTDINSKGKIGINNLHRGNVTVGNMSLGGGGTAGVGAGVAVTKDENITKTSITNNSHLQAANQIDIITKNDSNFDSLMASAGVGGVAGISGVVSVNNIENVVHTDITDSSIILNEQNTDTESSSEEGNHNININTTNNLNANITPIGAAVGSVGVAGVVTVNTINSSVLTNITDGNIEIVNSNAKSNSSDGYNINISSEENRDIDQTIVSVSAGAVAIGANVAINSIGTAVVNRGDSNIIETIEKANKEQDEKISAEILDILGKEDNDNSFEVTATGGRESTTDEGIKVNINGGALSAKNINVDAREFDDINMTSGGGTGGVVSASASVGITDIDRKLGVTINNARMTAENSINIGTSVSGKAEMEMYQGSLGAISLGAAYGELNAKGESLINLSGTNLSSNGDITVKVSDSSKLDSDAIGIQAGAVAAGAIISKIENDSDTKITVDDSEILADNKLSITTEKSNTVTANGVMGAAGLASGAGVDVSAIDKGASSIEIESNNIFKGSKDSINIKALNDSVITTKATGVAIGLLEVGGSLTEAISEAETKLIIKDGNTFEGITINLGAENIGTVTAETEGVGGGLVGINYNEAKAIGNGKVKIDIGKNQQYTTSKTTQDLKAGDVNISGLNSYTLKADTYGMNIGGLISSGNNQAVTESSGEVLITVDGGHYNNVSITANNITNNSVKADGNGGGIISIDAMAAKAENKVSTDTIINLNGNWNVENKLTAEALETNKANIQADSTKATLAGYSGTETKNTIKDKTLGTVININKNTEITGSGEISTLAKNTSDVNITSYGSGYGGITINGTTATNDIRKTAEINIAGKVLTDKKQKYEAFADNTINIDAYVSAAGVGAATLVKIDNTLVNDNTVNLLKDAVLKTDKKEQDITLAASDNLDITLKAKADVKTGAGGGASSKTNNSSTRNNSINALGYIRSMDDINLYAGKNAIGNKAELQANIAAEAYNSALIPISDPELNNKFYQNNTVVVGNSDVNKNGNIESVCDINISAADGQIRMQESSVQYTWATGKDKEGSYVTSSGGKIEDPNNSLVRNNLVTLDGTLVAGIQNLQSITINGIVDFSKNLGEEGTLDGATNTPDIIVSDEVDKSKIEYGIIDDYGKELKTQYDYNYALMSEYSKLGDTKAVAGFEAECNRLANKMEELGLGFKNEKNEFILVGKMSIQTITIPDIVASGGNIVIDTTNIKGTGSLEAKGAPKIEVINNSNLYLNINDLTIGDRGGEIKYNGISIGNAGLEGLNSLNADQNIQAQFTKVGTSDPGEAKIVITNNWNSKVNVITEKNADGSIKTEAKDVLTGIQINGEIRNLVGEVDISTKKGDILIEGDSENKAGGSINAYTIKLSAMNGSVSQGFVNGIKNIGSDPMAGNNWGNLSDEFIQKMKDEGRTQDEAYSNYLTYGKGTQTSNSGGIVAGGDIYINASDININGLIQSGFENYELVLTENDVETINKLKEQWQKAGSPDITDTLLENYKINSGDSYEGTKYIVQAYYNPQTDEVVVKDIDPKGGHIYLTGRISSTGNGEVKALDGAANVSITNGTDRNITVNNISNGNAQGLISITDTIDGNTIITEYTKDNVTQYQYLYDKDKKETVKEKIENPSQSIGSYNPDSGLRYNWAEGSKTENGYKYSWSKEFKWWGLQKYKAEEIYDALKDDSGTSAPVPLNSTETPTKNGEYIGKVNGVNNAEDFVLVFDNSVGSQSTVITNEGVEYDNWTHFSGTQYYEYTYSFSSGQTYLSSVKADREIKIGFFGSEDGKIEIAGNQDVVLNGSLTNNSLNGTVDITSKNGAIEQKGGSIYSNNITLNAKTGIENISITSIGKIDEVTKVIEGDIVNLSAITENGNIGIDVNSGFFEGTRLNGNISINNIQTGSGQITLNADGNIYQVGTEASVTGNRIDLASRNGNIDLIVQGGTDSLTASDSMENSINASAKENIKLTQNDGDFRIGRISSENGDVEVIVNNGNLVDALPTGEISDNSVEEKIQNWKDMGLIASDNSDEAKQEKLDQNIKDFEENVKSAYETYKDGGILDTQKEAYFKVLDENPNMSDTEKANAKAKYEESHNKSKEEFNKKYGEWNTAEEYLANNNYKGEIEDKQWTQDNLLYAIREGMDNVEGGSTQKEIKDPNISAHNIKITVKGGGVGVDAGEETVSLENLNNNVEVLKKLAAAEAADVEWKEGQAVISHKNPIGLQLKASTEGTGKLTIEAEDNVYLAARTEGNIGNELNTFYIDHIKTTDNANIRIQGTGGIFSVEEITENNGVNFTGKDLILEGGEKDLGTLERELTTNLKGTLTARTEGNTYIRQQGDTSLIISSLYSGGDVVIKSNQGILSEEDSLGYINSVNGNITLEADGDIGNTSTELRVKNTENTTNTLTAISKNGDIYLVGKNTISELDGGLNIVKMSGNNVNVKGEAELNINGNVTGTNNVSIAAEKDIVLNSGTITGKNLTMNSETGSINQLAQNTITANTVTAHAITGINLGTETNKFNTINLANNTGDILVNNSGASGLTVTFDRNTNAGNVIINNATGNMSVTGSIEASEDGHNLEFTNGSGDIVITEGTDLTAGNDILVKTDSGNINTNNSNITAGKDITLEASGGITNTNTLTAGNNILVQGNTGNILLNKSEAGNGVDIITNVGDITITGNTTAEKGSLDILAKVKGAIKVVGNLFANTNTKVQNNKGDINIVGNITSSNGNTSIIGNSGNIDLSGALVARIDTNISTTNGYINTNGTITSGDNITIATTDGNITTEGDINATNRNINISTENNGNITSNGNITAGTDIAFITNIGNININKDRDDLTVTSGNSFLAETNNGSIELGGKVNAGTTADILTNIGDINIDKLEANDMVNIIAATEGAITNKTSLKSINDSLKAQSAKGDVNLNDVYAKKTAEVIAKDGNIYIKKINGDYVIITLGKKDKTMQVDEQTVGKGTLISSNDLTIDNLYQREGENSPVEVTLKNSEDNTNAPISYAELHAKGLENGMLVNQLWVQDAEITTDREILQFPELVVTGKGHFANSSTTTTVYGIDSAYDDSNIHIWNDADTKDWIILNFLLEENSIYTTGRLLKLKDGFYVYDQRISAEDYMIEHLRDYAAIEHKLNEVRDPFKFVFKPYLSYNLIDNTVSSSVVNTPEIVTVENNKIIISENGKVTEVTLEPTVKINTEEKDNNKITATGLNEVIKVNLNDGSEKVELLDITPIIINDDEEEEIAVLEKN